MGDVTMEPVDAEGIAGSAMASTALDEVLWDPIARATVLRSHPMFDERVLDACSGDGASVLPTAELVGPGGLVDALVSSEEVIGSVRERAGERMPQLRLHVGDPTEWPYTGYDLVQCVLGMPSFADPEAGARHLVECARPGGRAAFTVWARGALDPLPELLAAAIDGGDAGTRAAGESDPPESPAPGLPALHDADTAGTLAHWLGGLGLVDVRAEAINRHLDLDADLAWALIVGTPLRSLLGDLDDKAVSAVRERYLAALAEREPPTVDITTLVAVGRRPE